MRKYTLYYTRLALTEKALTLGIRVTQYLVVAYTLSFKNISSHYAFKCGGSEVEVSTMRLPRGWPKEMATTI